MNNEKFELEFITPAFLSGANQKQAELRAPSIRGQLRWWYRVLGGFKILAHDCKNLNEQEIKVFGGMSGVKEKNEKTPVASCVKIRVDHRVSYETKHANDLNAGVNTAKGYLIFPLRPKKGHEEESKRGVFMPATESARFNVYVSVVRNREICDSVRALMTVMCHLGALGTRSRRGFGALYCYNSTLTLSEALSYFSNPDNITIKTLEEVLSSDQALDSLGRWLQGWRSHGRSPNLSKGPGFKYAKKDHDIGLQRDKDNAIAYRPALGLPIIQRYSSGQTVNWEAQTGSNKGRFASPVILRPYRVLNKKWLPLVIFADTLRWKENKCVYIDNTPVAVSLELYHAMKDSLQDFKLK
jgi:CRISPR type III-B/RAMP module RAMP protein Cmr1